jgi:hypothetical protein
MDLQLLTHREGRNQRTIRMECEGKIVEYMVPKGQLGITISQISNQPEKQQEK